MLSGGSEARGPLAAFRMLRRAFPENTMIRRSSQLVLCIAASVLAACFGDGENEAPRARATGADWPAYLGDNGSSQYSPLTQITPGNVRDLEVAWTYRSGDANPDDRSQVQCNPLVLDGVLYGTTPGMKMFAIDAATGEELWTFDPFAEGYTLFGAGVNRGLMAHGAGDDLRLFYGAGDQFWAVWARSGMPDEGFGEGGSIDLHVGLGREAQDLFVVANTPGVVWYDPEGPDLLVLGHRTAESLPSAPGTIRALDAVTGDIVWAFETIPRPGEPFSETWPAEAHATIGGANSWAGMALDAERGIVFVPTGSAAFDYWGGNRPGENLFANTLLALDVRTGERLWHFQTVHHDIWDRDLPAPPNLVTVTHDGRTIDAVAQITKSAHVFLFDRETGEPLFPVEEVEIPQTPAKQAVPGEAPWPTQPVPVKPAPFSRQRLQRDNLNRVTPEVERWSEDTFRLLRSDGQFTPPSLEGSVILPGLDGGGEWGGAAASPEGILYVNGSEMPWLLRLVEVQQGEIRTTADWGRRTYAQHCLSCHGVERRGQTTSEVPDIDRLTSTRPESWVRRMLAQGRGRMPAFEFFDEEELSYLLDYLYDRTDVPLPETDRTSLQRRGYGSEGLRLLPYSLVAFQRLENDAGYPLIEPPWGTLNAIDLNTGELLWKVPHGDFPEIPRESLQPYGLERTGAQQYGGPIVTASGVLFIAGTLDEKIWAYDASNGDLLWSDTLPAGGYATPATYEAGGRQFVVVAAGGGKMGTKSSDAWVAYALPEEADP